MSLISRFPEGLLAFLDLKSRGEVPFTLDSSVRPGVEMAPFWELGGNPRNTFTSVNAPITAGVQIAPTGPPLGEVWLVRSAALLYRVAAAGEQNAVQLRMVRGGSILTTILGIATAASGLSEYAGQEFVTVWQPQWPMFWRAGDVIFGDARANLVAPAVVQLTVSYTPFRA